MSKPKTADAGASTSTAHWVLGGLSFVAGRGSVFLFPFLLAATVPTSSYGKVERALAIAGMIAIVFEGGVSGSLVYFVLKKGREEYLTSAALYATCAQGISLLCAIGFALLGLNLMAMISALVGLVVGQGILGGRARVRGQSSQAFLFDSILYSIGTVAIVWLALFEEQVNVDSLVVVWSITLAVLTVVSTRILCEGGPPGPGVIRRVRGQLGLGSKLIVSALLASSLVLLPRGLGGVLLGDSATAQFALYFRFASVALVAHGFLQTMLYKELYGGERADAVKLFGRNLVIVAAVGAMVLVFVVVGMEQMNMLAHYRPGENLGLMILFSATVVAWAATAQLEQLIYQEQMVATMIVALAAVVGGFVVAMLALSWFGHLNVKSLAAVNNVAMFLYLVAQYRILRTRNIDVSRNVAAVSLYVMIGLAAVTAL